MIVKLTPQEVYNTRRFGEKVYQLRTQDNSADMLMAHTTKGAEASVMGFLGEHAFHKLFGRVYVYDYKKGPTDLVLDGWRIDIKTTMYHTLRLQVPMWKLDMNDMYVMMIQINESTYRWNGWLYTHDIKAHGEVYTSEQGKKFLRMPVKGIETFPVRLPAGARS